VAILPPSLPAKHLVDNRCARTSFTAPVVKVIPKQTAYPFISPAMASACFLPEPGHKQANAQRTNRPQEL
jgi:hypothetical protein